jgi:putative Holliday junction resolvase
MGRILAIDYGKKRTGLAVTDPLKLVPGGLITLPSQEALAFVVAYCERENVERVLLGQAIQPNQQPSESMRYIEPFYRALVKRLPIPVEYVDERFTSVLAHRAMLEGGLRKKDRQNKALVDQLSAVILLQSYLEAHSPNESIENV